MEHVCGFPKGRFLSGDTAVRPYPRPVSLGLPQRQPALSKAGFLLTDQTECFRTVCLQSLVFSGGRADNLWAPRFSLPLSTHRL